MQRFNIGITLVIGSMLAPHPCMPHGGYFGGQCGGLADTIAQLKQPGL